MIVPAIDSSEDIGSLGINEGTATTYPWKWYYSAPALGIWLLLALAILSVRDNRDPRVLLIFIPIFLVRLLWSWFLPILGVPSSIMVVFGMLVDALVIGLAVLWLLAYKLGNRNRFASLLLALIMLLAATMVTMMSYQAWLYGIDSNILIIQALAIITILLVFFLTGWLCRKRYGPLRFMLWMALWVAVISLVVMFIFFLISVRPSSATLIRQMPEVLVAGLILALCIYVLNLPFMILAFVSPFYGRRFYAYFHLRSMPIASRSGTGKPPGDDSGQTE